MINLQPYQNPTYFVLLAVALLPLAIGLLYGKRFKVYEMIVSFAFLLLTFGGVKLNEGLALLGYVIFETLLVCGYHAYRKKQNSGYVFVLAVVLAIAPLLIFKLTPFVTGKPSILGFLGISYLTFKVVGTVMETRDGMIRELKWYHVLHFLLFFPTISSGPIDRYRRFRKDYEKVPSREKYLELLGKGVWNIFLGFFYKFILAYAFGTLILPIVSKYALGHGGISWWLVAYMYVYAMDLFFDFAG